MSKHDEFVTVVNTLKAASPTITTEQRLGLLRQAVQQYALSVDEASKILDASGLIVGEKASYFEILGVSIEELQSQSEADIITHIDEAHHQRYEASLRAGARIRSDGRSEEQWRVILNQARDTLKDPEKRREHIVSLQRDKDNAALGGDAHPIFKFPNGDEATSIPQLAALMAKHSTEATDALYRGYLEQSLGRAGEMHFASAARATAREFPNDRELGCKAMVQILRGKMEFEKGIESRAPRRLDQDQEMVAQKPNEAGTPKQLALMIDRNWQQAKTLLYNGFIALWFEYTKQPQLASISKKIMKRYGNDQDVGLEMLVQELDPQIGQPELEISHTHVNFGKVDTETRAKIQVKIRNVGRGFLYGDVQLASELPGFHLRSRPIRGEAGFTIQLEASHLTVKQLHETELVVSTNSGTLQVPISGYVDYPVAKSIRRVLISSAAVATIALVTCLIILQFEHPGWLAARLAGTDFIDWEQYWDRSWIRATDQWLWINWSFYTLDAPRTGLGFVLALILLGIGIFGYWFVSSGKEKNKFGNLWAMKSLPTTNRTAHSGTIYRMLRKDLRKFLNFMKKKGPR